MTSRLPLLGAGPSLARVSATVVLALLPALSAAVVEHGLRPVASLLATTIASGGVFEVLFARGRRRPLAPGLLPTAIAFTLLLPADASLPQAAIAMAFGVVFGREVFGGAGFGFLPVPAVAAAFLHVAWPAAAGPGSPRLCEVTPYTSALGALVLLGGRVAHVASLWVFPTVVFATLWRVTGSSDVEMATVAFGAAFLVADPTTAPLTTSGRVGLGLVAGVLVVLARTFHPARPDGVVLAVLFGGVVAPLVDHLALRVGTWRRRARERLRG